MQLQKPVSYPFAIQCRRAFFKIAAPALVAGALGLGAREAQAREDGVAGPPDPVKCECRCEPAELNGSLRGSGDSLVPVLSAGGLLLVVGVFHVIESIRSRRSLEITDKPREE